MQFRKIVSVFLNVHLRQELKISCKLQKFCFVVNSYWILNAECGSTRCVHFCPKLRVFRILRVIGIWNTYISGATSLKALKKEFLDALFFTKNCLITLMHISFPKMLFKPTVTTMIIFYEHDNIYVHTLLVYQKKGFDGVDMYIFCLTLKNYWWELQMHNALVWVYFWAKT